MAKQSADPRSGHARPCSLLVVRDGQMRQLIQPRGSDLFQGGVVKLAPRDVEKVKVLEPAAVKERREPRSALIDCHTEPLQVFGRGPITKLLQMLWFQEVVPHV